MVFKEEQKPQKQILFFTASWCKYCELFKQTQLQKLMSNNLTISNKEDAMIRIVDVDLNPMLYNKYAKTKKTIPYFVLLKDGEEVKNLVGFQTAEKILELWKQ